MELARAVQQALPLRLVRTAVALSSVLVLRPAVTQRLRQLFWPSCVEEITPDGRLIPFCAYNSVGYREQVRERLTGMAVPQVVPNANTLAPLLADSAHGSKL